MRTRFALFIAAALLTGAAAPADGAPMPVLKDSSTVDSEFVRLGDLIDNVGEKANAPLFRAPELGTTGTIQVYRIIEAARAQGVTVFDTRGISEVLISRASRGISLADLQHAVADTASKQIGTDAKNIAVAFDSGVRPLAVEPNAAAEPRLIQFNYDTRSQRFDATLEVPGSALTRRKPARLTGWVYETAEVATLLRPLQRGEIVREGDLLIARRPKADVAADVIKQSNAIVGQAARRDLRQDEPIRAADLMKPELVGRGEAVTLIFESPGVKVSVRGKAVEGGTEGDLIQVLNPQSKRVVQATVEGPGLVVVRRVQTARNADPETTGSLK